MPSILPDHVRKAVAARVPEEVREAFDAAVDAVNDLTAANRVLAAHHRDLPQQAAHAAQTGGAR